MNHCGLVLLELHCVAGVAELSHAPQRFADARHLKCGVDRCRIRLHLELHLPPIRNPLPVCRDEAGSGLAAGALFDLVARSLAIIHNMVCSSRIQNNVEVCVFWIAHDMDFRTSSLQDIDRMVLRVLGGVWLHPPFQSLQR